MKKFIIRQFFWPFSDESDQSSFAKCLLMSAISGIKASIIISAVLVSVLLLSGALN